MSDLVGWNEGNASIFSLRLDCIYRSISDISNNMRRLMFQFRLISGLRLRFGLRLNFGLRLIFGLRLSFGLRPIFGLRLIFA